MDDIEHLELTPSLLKFYRSRIHDLKREQNTLILNQLKHVEMSAQERKALERELLEYRDELHETQQDLDDIHNAFIRERRAVIELVEEQAQLRGTYPYMITSVFWWERYGDAGLDSAVPGTDPKESLRKQYETLLSSILADHKVYLAQIRLERDTMIAKLEDLASRCARLETAVMEGTKELIKERAEKQALQIRVEEMQTSIEQRIQDLRRRLDESGRGPLSKSAELDKLKLENKQLKTRLEDSKVHNPQTKFIIESLCSTIICSTRSNSTARATVASAETIVDPPPKRFDRRDYELGLHVNPIFRDQIKQIERLALRYAPLQGPDVDHLFSEIEYAKDVIDGIRPPPPIPSRSKSKRKKKV
jgi:hypothetical protein